MNKLTYAEHPFEPIRIKRGKEHVIHKSTVRAKSVQTYQDNTAIKPRYNSATRTYDFNKLYNASNDPNRIYYLHKYQKANKINIP